MAGVTRVADFDHELLQFGKYRLNSGGKGGAVSYTYNGVPLRIQTPVGMRLPFGISTYPDSDPPKKTIDFDLDGHDAFREVIEAVEVSIKAHAVENGREMFNKKDVSAEELAMMARFNFRSSIKAGKEGYSPTFKASVEHYKGADKIAVFVGDAERSTLGCSADVVKNTTGTAILELKSFWVVDGA
jgi:hypothetical protein